MSLLKVIAIGHVGRDPETRQAGTDNTVTTFSIATTKKDKKSGTDKTTWLRINAWNRTGEVIAEHVKKGQQLYVEGELTSEEYQDKDGNTRTSLEVRLENFQFCGGKSTEDAPKAKAASAGTDNSSEIPF